MLAVVNCPYVTHTRHSSGSGIFPLIRDSGAIIQLIRDHTGYTVSYQASIRLCFSICRHLPSPDYHYSSCARC